MGWLTFSLLFDLQAAARLFDQHLAPFLSKYEVKIDVCLSAGYQVMVSDEAKTYLSGCLNCFCFFYKYLFLISFFIHNLLDFLNLLLFTFHDMP